MYLGRLWTLDGQPAPRCNREAKADPMGAFVRDAHFVRSPALAPAPAAVPETKPPHTPLRTAHDPLRLASPAASCLVSLRHPPLCPHRTPLCASLPLPPRVQDNKYGATPLIVAIMVAIIEKNTALVPVLLDAGADVNAAACGCASPRT